MLPIEPGKGGSDNRAGSVVIVGGMSAAAPTGVPVCTYPGGERPKPPEQPDAPAVVVEPAPCQVCGFDTAPHQEAVRVIRNTARHPNELLALLCMPCFARGILWSAKHTLPPKHPHTPGTFSCTPGG